jgi:hypothetical protein
MPGTQQDGFKNYGMIITPNVHAFFIPGWDIWLGADFQGVGNGVGDEVGISPKIGASYSPLKPPGSGNQESSDGNGAPSGSSESAGKPDRWHIGIAGGYTNNELFTAAPGRYYTEYENGHGFLIGLPYRYQVNRWFAFQGEVQYIQKNYTWQRTGPFDKAYTTVTNSFVDFPLMAHFSFGGKDISAFANVGVYGGFWAASSRKGTLQEGFSEDTSNPNYYDFDESVEFNQQRDARFDGGLLAGLGVQYAIRSCTFFAEGRYYHGLTDLQQNYGYFMVPRKNNTFAIHMGVLFNRNIFN